jgi:transcriptional regulator GlxA family with amidase domain
MDDPTGLALQRVLELMDARYAERLDLATLCEEAHFSRYHFIRTFRSRLYETPHQYLMRRRIDRARELLATTDRSVTDICFEVGFESLGSFSSLFRRVVGWPPSVYRARSLEQRLRPRAFIPACCWTMFGLDRPSAAG